MAIASATISPGYQLTAVTPAPGQAPVTYSINGVVVGTDITADINAGAQGLFFNTVKNSDGTFTITAGLSARPVFTGTQAQAATFTNGIFQATQTVLNRISAEVKTAAPAPAPAPTPRVTSNVVTKTTVTNTTNTTATATANATTTSNSITRTTVTNTTSSTSGSRTVTVAPQKDVPTVTTVSDLPIKIVTDPITVTLPQFDSRGRVTGNTQVTLDAPPITVDDPLQLVVTDEPLVANLNLDIPLVDLPDFSSVDAAILETQGEATAQDQANFEAKEDWRVRLSLAPNSQYLYNAKPDPGILKPLLATDGVIFPYTPTISVNYAASYEQTNLVHSNYKIFQYSGSGVDSVSIACAFTAQDTFEANYLLAVIHFFRSMTKMFYGQDDNPKNGTPPPLCYMFGMGGYQFAAHPLAIQGFSYTLPDDVDYIKTTSASPAGVPRSSAYTASDTRLAGTGLGKGGKSPGPTFSTSPGNDTVTWVPTRIQMTITCVPIMSRNAVSNRFSLRDYASGALLNGTRVPGGGMW